MSAKLLSDSQFSSLTKLAYERWGLDITDRKRDLVENRLTQLLRKGHYSNVEQLLDMAQASTEALLPLFDALSTNHTSFYREADHFRCLVDHLRSENGGNNPRNGSKLRIWSAACSNGSEPYTLTMVLQDEFSNLKNLDVRILGTDLSQTVLGEAKRAFYTPRQLEGLDREILKRHFIAQPGGFQVKPELTRLVSFGLLNLMGDWPMKGPFDVIFCRNVMIYFDPPTKARLLTRMMKLLRPNGLLIIGSSEGAAGKLPGLKPLVPGAFVRE
ncbi:MAG: CheR family methyltransferase [Planctomycetota bacterium]